ncbi:MAG: DNA topoisomerase IV subunit A [Planctomycetota bacterium]|nr:DNA topoisomerase IV subunit A [Planctomycetota bacterium]
MARKKTASKSKRPASGKSSGRPKGRKNQAGAKITGFAESVVKSASQRRDPAIVIPMRTLSNANYNKKRRIIEMGCKTATRNFFDLGKAKSFMQSVLIASGCKKLIDENKTVSIRGLYYLSKHTIPGTSEKTFNDQNESDPIIEDLEVSLGSLREELHVFADNRGSIAGNLTVVSLGDEINLRKMGASGFAIPSIVEPDVFQFRKCEAKFILHVEKGTIWSRFNEDKFWKKHNCILIHGGGQPPRGVRRLLFRMHDELKLPLYCLLDNDPWGYYIYSVIKQGSINLAFESQRMAVPDARFIGVRSRDFEEFDLSDDVKIAVDDKDIKRAKQILNYPWFKGKKDWEKEVNHMLEHGFKMEVESLLTKSISFVTETYVPQKLKRRNQWLD